MAKNSNQFTVQIEGWEELEAKLKSIASHINTGEVLEEAMMEGAEVVKAAIEANAPRRTHQLAGSITISKQGRQAHSLRIGPSGQGFYGRFLEYGTSRMGARPFVRPGFDSSRGEAEALIGKRIWAKVEEAAG